MTGPSLTPLRTEWGERLDPDAPLPEYPRPQLVRDSYVNLNGRWEYAITGTDEPPPDMAGDIVVPFSPESLLSGVQRQLQPGEVLHYRRVLPAAADVPVPAGSTPAADDRVLLHFGAVDQSCRVLVGSRLVAEHDGGYLPFSCDVTDDLAGGPAVLQVVVRDPSDTGVLSRGKQRLKRGGIWYTAQSGIWQTVWLERVPAVSVERLEIVPDLAAASVAVTVHALARPAGTPAARPVTVSVGAGDQVLATTAGVTGVPLRIPVPGPRLWSPEDPFLYNLQVTIATDTVTSYFGMRSFAVGPDSRGIPRLLLNGRPYFHAGVLDQGYWPDGLYTAPSDEALVHDIATMKDLGFTMLRKHIKIEPLRWYYHCDRLGMLVWQDMVNGGGRYHPAVMMAGAAPPVRLSDRHRRLFARTDAAGRAHWLAEARETVEQLRNAVCIAMWVPFNEGWGQFDARQVAAAVRRIDPTRTVDHASGWYDQGAGDVTSRHVYLWRFRPPRRDPAGRALVLSEYGGYSLGMPGHTVSGAEFGYRRFSTQEELTAAYARLHAGQIIPAVAHALAATVYTQLSDVEDEINGLLTYDRRVLKVPAAVVRSINRWLVLR